MFDANLPMFLLSLTISCGSTLTEIVSDGSPIEVINCSPTWSLVSTGGARAGQAHPHLATPGHTWSHLVTPGHTWSHLVTPGHTCSHLATLDHTWSHLTKPDHTCWLGHTSSC